MTPAAPSALNWGGGVGSTSMRSMSRAGMDCRFSPAFEPDSSAEGFPSMRMRTLLSPRSETMPSGSTSTEGIALKTSPTEPKLACTSFAML